MLHIKAIVPVILFAFLGFQVAVADNVQQMNDEISSMKKQIAQEKEHIHVLQTEWSYLTRPERIARLEQKFLKLNDTHGQQLAELSDLPFSDEGPIQLAEGEVTIAPYGGVNLVSADAGQAGGWYAR